MHALESSDSEASDDGAPGGRRLIINRSKLMKNTATAGFVKLFDELKRLISGVQEGKDRIRLSLPGNERTGLYFSLYPRRTLVLLVEISSADAGSLARLATVRFTLKPGVTVAHRLPLSNEIESTCSCRALR